jgi:glyoxylase-like metal-dependent hydrolase (beta-lactamase superfamily II)
VLGLIALHDGIVLIDAPYRAKDVHSWRRTCSEFGQKQNTALVMLDTHIDRTLGVRDMDVNVIAHRNTFDILNNQSLVIKQQDIPAGAALDSYEMPVNFRWALPDMSFTDELSIHWDHAPIIISHRPGAHLAGCWVRYDAEKVIFVGDSVVLKQLPYLAWSDLPTWLSELALLRSDAFRDYTIVSGRDGVITQESIEQMQDFLSSVKDCIDDWALSGLPVEEVISNLPEQLAQAPFNQDIGAEDLKCLQWGFESYLQRHKSNFYSA